MGVNRKKNIAKMDTSYVKQREAAEISKNRKRKLLYRRLTAFLFLVVAVSVLMISTLVSQSSTLEAKGVEKKRLETELTELEKTQKILDEEIVKLNDDEYIAKLARKDYYLSEKGEIIFKMPENEKEKKKKDEEKQEKENTSD
ncbi:FtsB family cell division protein [Cytobacillus purgationiresistens]|uniref:Cell division protein DivIC n=1 Tax=Cytobacillus purgationiresistens TaxID=863449 RepID=A0ABU0AP71_9BACI|nr:septum formation initiator family protein [Cytobacillus purgationiresistens]MDQ0273088.1 cell division protein DivIC [Cytobacillus purgationiresistens]